ncbi:MAG: hypothetical protein EAZ47_11525 [Bacteroidetes bacterium]|nr:MAG: hypothetical protein EAY72_04810 [Bacteroidota bacterium]TAF89756.1 MAG: hypothetical protein EAZ47_11525 [Bacteroidota bacterium]
MKNKLNMNFPKVNFENRDTVLFSFERIAEKFAHTVYLKVNNASYRLVDFEFYAFGNALPDPHTYKHEQQLAFGKLYAHGSGIDITFGDGTNYCGMLVRSVVKLYEGTGPESGFMKQQIEGPQNVATELLGNLYALTDGKPNDVTFVDIQGRNQDASFYPAKHVLSGKRIGLTPKPTDPEDVFMNMRLRFVPVLPKFQEFKQSIRGVESLLTDLVKSGKLETGVAHDILGYQKVF